MVSSLNLSHLLILAKKNPVIVTFPLSIYQATFPERELLIGFRLSLIPS